MIKAGQVEISWSRKYHNIYDYNDTPNDYFYMVILEKKKHGKLDYNIMYIGMTYDQWITDRFKKHHKYWKIVYDKFGKDWVYVKIGKLIPTKERKITKRLVQDVEAHLILATQPPYNEQYPTPSKMLIIINNGSYSPLSKIISPHEWMD